MSEFKRGDKVVRVRDSFWDLASATVFENGVLTRFTTLNDIRGLINTQI